MSGGMTNNATTPKSLDDAFFKRLFDGAGLPIMACDLEGNILAWNPLAETIAQEGAGPVADMHISDLLPQDLHPVLAETLRLVIDTHEPAEFRARISREDNLVEYAVWLTPMFDGDDKLDYICAWFHDITARLQLRRGMRKRERLTSLGALAGSVAHHYNNLLCSIATSLEFSLNMNTITAMRRVLRRTADAVGRATRLTHQLLAFAQGDHRMCDLADLTELVLQYFDQHEVDFAAQGIKLDMHWERVPFIPLPREQFNIVLENLARNAVEAMPSGGVLSVNLSRRDENNVLLAIADSGPGITPDTMEHLFEPFFTTKGELNGGDARQSGMGLAVIHGLIAEMHGAISADNKPGGGARFEICLPVNSFE